MKKLKIGLSTSTILLTLLFAITLGIVPIFTQFIITSKIFLTFIFVFVVILAYLLSSWKNKSFSLLKTPFAPAVALFGIMALISSLMSEAYPVSNLLGMGGIMISFTVLTLLGSTLIKKKDNITNIVLKSLSAIAILLIVTTLLQNFGVGISSLVNKVLGEVAPNNLSFSLVGSTFIALQITVLTIVGLISKIIISKKAKLWEMVSLLIAALSSVFYGWTILPGKITSLVILDPSASWSIMLSVLGNLKTVLFGVGPINYGNVFNQFRPAWLNNTQLANIQFTQASNFPMTIVVTLGVVGLFAWVWLIVTLIKETKKIKTSTRPIHNVLLASFAIATFMPINIILIVIQAVLLVFWVASERERLVNYKFNFPTTRFVRLPKIAQRIVVLLLTLSVVFVFALTARVAYADSLMFQSSRALVKNDFINAYVLQQKAVSINPYSDQNRKQYGLTNITIAAALSQKAELTDAEKEQFSQLIQQAIREGKAAVLLDEMDTNNWRTLAQIYQTLFGVADNSGEWAVKSYVEAIKLSPTDANLRVRLGGIFYANGEYDEALRFFVQATDLNPNMANAYYNIANTLIRLERYQEAMGAYQRTLLLVRPDSDDYLKASEEMKILEEGVKQLIEEELKKQAGAEGASLDGVTPVESVEPQQVEAPPQPPQQVEDVDGVLEE